MSILVATDFSDNSKAAIRRAARMANRHGTGLTILHCRQETVGEAPWRAEMPRSRKNDYRNAALEHLETLVDEVMPSPDRPDSVAYAVEFDRPADGILRLVDGGAIDAVVLGATGRNQVAKFLLGSTPEDVARRSDVPVLVVPDDAPEGDYETIVAPIDFSECSRESLQRAVGMARDYGARLTVVHAYRMPATAEAAPLPSMAPARPDQDLEERRTRHFERFLDDFDFEGVEFDARQKQGRPDTVIDELVDETGADLVVMGTHGREGFERLVLGSTASKVLRRMPCSVMTVRVRSEIS